MPIVYYQRENLPLSTPTEDQSSTLTIGLPVVEENCVFDPLTQRQTLEGHTNSVYSIAFSPDSRQLASGSLDRTVRLWDPKTGKALQTLEGHTARVHFISFLPTAGSLLQARGIELYVYGF